MNIYLPGIELKLKALSSGIQLEPLGSSLYEVAISPVNLSFDCVYSIVNQTDKGGMKTMLSGESFDGAEIPYRWKIMKEGADAGIYIDFFEDNQLEEVFCRINFNEGSIHTSLVPKTKVKEVVVDPLFQPFGSVLMVVLAHYQNDIIIHASGTIDNGTGRLFTAVSGTGKSTMAGLWEKSGGKIINDDRLWLHKVDDQWHFFNTPMPYYAQRPLEAPLNEIFLLRQSIHNEIKKLTGVNAAMRFMANAIQHFYDKKMTERHLDKVLDISSRVPIYDCGFKPDQDIVEAIRKQAWNYTAE